jgi:adenine specific DNA methylase Mod
MKKEEEHWKKADILAKTQVIKEFLLNNASNPKYKEYISEIERYISLQKKGLNFEHHPEEFDDESACIPYNFTEMKEFSIEKGGMDHVLIESENLLALCLLKRTHLGKIDLICVDPPYNTGNKKLKYNDSDYVDPDDEYSHSKWLSFMEKRLHAAYDLLTPTGVMYVNIDETQTGCLIMLCEQIFGEANVTVMIWPKMDPKYDQNRVEKPIVNVKTAHEYVILCYKDKANTHFNKIMKRPNYADFSVPEQPMWMETILFEMGTTSSAKDELCELFGTRDIFATPKPLKMMKEFVRAAAGTNAIVLDIFAGSGTTGHAVMDLNQEDDGQRRTILITNNENNICRAITYERLKRAIEKYHYTVNLKYYIVEPPK